MTPTPSATATPPMRQSCDRCHKQKLRCTRAGNSNTGACDRCLRKRVQCVYSSSLPKGRPSIYRSTDDSTGLGSGDRSSPLPQVPVTQELHHRGSVVSSQNGSAEAGNDDNDGSMKVDVSTDMDVQPNSSDHSPMSKPADDISVGNTTHHWSWVDPFNWDDTQVDWGDLDSGQPRFDWPTMTNTEQTDVTAAYITAFQGLSDRTAIGKNSDGDNSANSEPSPRELTQNLPHFPEYGHGHGIGHLGVSNDTSDPDVVIAELAQLSVRLSPLRRSSYDLAEISQSSCHPGQAHHTPLIDDAAFESVAVWLAHGSVSVNIPSTRDYLPAPESKTIGAMLCNVFSASHHLLETLRWLANNAGSSTFTCSTPVPSSTPSTTTVSSETSYFRLPKGSISSVSSSSSLSSSYPGSPGSSSSNSCSHIIRHLVIACHTMILNIFPAVVAILEHDANARAHRDTAVLGSIR